ncbi:MAG: NUDIX hydrolase [Solirubrobacterales bacterium]
MSSGQPSPAELASRLAPALLAPAEARQLPVHGSKEAAVLVAIYEQAGELGTVLTRRRSDLRRHAGEISFPGGRRDPGEPELVETALREAHEEIGLLPATVHVAGALPPTPTIATGYAIHPFVGAISTPQDWAPSEREVEEIIEVPLSVLAGGYGRRRLIRRGIPFVTDTYELGDSLVWGATARILAGLFGRLSAAGLA